MTQNKMADIEEERITLHVKSTKQKLDIEIAPSQNVAKLKELVKDMLGEEVKGDLCLIFAGKILKDEDSLVTHGLTKSGLTIHLVIRPHKATAPSSAQTSTNTSGGVTTPTQSSSTSSTSGGGGAPPMNPFSMFGGGASLPGDMQAQMQQMMANPEMMRQIMESPMMQGLLSNPEALQTVLTGNPQIQQLMERNPELSHILHNPDLMRQAMEMASNQSAMRELMRSQDRQLSNIESLPGGFNALARMYSEIQEPMMDAAQETLQQQLESNPFAALFQGGQNTPQPGPSAPPGTTNTTPLPNPWGGGGATTNQSSSSTASTSEGGGANTGGSTTPTSGSGQANLLAQMLSGSGQGGAMGGMGGLEMLSNPAYREMYQRSMADPRSRQMISQLMQNPAFVRQMMQSLPPAMRQSMGNDPEAMSRLMQQSGEMFNNPQMMELMSNPEALQGMMRMMEGYQQMTNATGGNPLAGFGSMFGQPPSSSSTDSSTSTSTTSTSTSTSTSTTSTSTSQGGTATGQGGAPNLSLLSQMFGGAPSTQPTASGGEGGEMSTEERLAQRFRVQLGILEGMGFIERAANLQALQEANGDINTAIDKLLNRTPFF